MRDLVDLRGVYSNSDKTHIGLGFVVTQKNAAEIERVVNVAQKLGVDFIRFKPDIRGPQSLTWRIWRDAEMRIKDIQKQQAAHLQVYLTDVPWSHWRPSMAPRCWAQYFVASIGPDGGVYCCDHLTNGNGDCSLGNLRKKSFEEIWARAWGTPEFGRRRTHCNLCPPFNWRINRFMDSLRVIEENHGWAQLERWMDRLLNSSTSQLV